jgi:hypothetical protein
MKSKEMRMKLMEGTPVKETRASETVDIIKLTQNGEEGYNQDEDETTSDNSDNKNDEERFSLINNKVILLQELECDGENKGVNKVKTVILAQDITNNTQSDSVDKAVDS